MKHARANYVRMAVLVGIVVILIISGSIVVAVRINGKSTHSAGHKDSAITTTAGESETVIVTENTDTDTAPVTEAELTTVAPSVPTSVPTNTSSIPKQDPAPVGNKDFSGCLFIGNSRTEGLMLYSGISGATAYAVRGLTASGYFTTPAAELGGTTVTAAEAVEKGPAFSDVYIMLGINEIGYAYNSFYGSYMNIINHLHEHMPDARIYVQSIIPVTASRSAEDETFNNTNISAFNELLKKVCADSGAVYLDLVPWLCEANGALPEDAASDGLHLNKRHCQRWLDALAEMTR